MKFSLILLITFLLSNTAIASDSEGRFAIRNAGMSTCQNFVETKKNSPEKMGLYFGWIDGYISAANQYTTETYDLVPWGNTLFLATLIENHCKNNPNERFYVSVNKLAASMMHKRLKEQSKLIETNYKGNKTYIYKRILKDIQTKLIELGLYMDKADGNYGPNTRKAIINFQNQNGLAQTGLPDQLTIYKVLRAKEK
ncbi:MAG: peptidoglycan-binding protein [Gammaproteobacteria bacterium]|nr:peptidoglycan-binding protein [Gammaproteobacteria bacterium]